mmetsp:Transcript_17483/g.29890  ORF Transcript_17483/g.29890 Transcript_17483/m.29890 type:complete len:230 (-) Transcript_17483:347-1036(-)
MVDLRAVLGNLVGDEQRRHAVGRRKLLGLAFRLPVPLGILSPPLVALDLLLELVLLVGEVVHPRAQVLEVLLQVRVGAQVQALKVAVQPLPRHRVGARVLQVEEHRVDEARVADLDRELLEDAGRANELVARPLGELEKVLRQAKRANGEAPRCRLHGVVEEHHRVRDGVLVRGQVLDQLEVVEGAEEHGLVPPHAVVVHVHLPKARHHLQLVLLVLFRVVLLRLLVLR